MTEKLNDILSVAADTKDGFQSILGDCGPWRAKGVFFSEMLFLIAVSKKLGIKRLIESGRAAGYSTEILARYYKNTDTVIDSIEYLKDTPDAAIAEKRLADVANPNVHLHYGDSFEVMPRVLTDAPTAIFIDGPKGYDAIKLASDMLKHDAVKAVFIHDIYWEYGELRKFLEKTWSGYISGSDDPAYVEQFKSIDDPCWAVIAAGAQGSNNSAPFTRFGKPTRSYGSPLIVLFQPDAKDKSRVLAATQAFIAEKQNSYGLFLQLSKLFPKTLKQNPLYVAAKKQVLKLYK